MAKRNYNRLDSGLLVPNTHKLNGLALPERDLLGSEIRGKGMSRRRCCCGTPEPPHYTCGPCATDTLSSEFALTMSGWTELAGEGRYAPCTTFEINGTFVLDRTSSHSGTTPSRCVLASGYFEFCTSRFGSSRMEIMLGFSDLTTGGSDCGDSPSYCRYLVLALRGYSKAPYQSYWSYAYIGEPTPWLAYYDLGTNSSPIDCSALGTMTFTPTGWPYAGKFGWFHDYNTSRYSSSGVTISGYFV